MNALHTKIWEWVCFLNLEERFQRYSIFRALKKGLFLDFLVGIIGEFWEMELHQISSFLNEKYNEKITPEPLNQFS